MFAASTVPWREVDSHLVKAALESSVRFEELSDMLFVAGEDDNKSAFELLCRYIVDHSLHYLCSVGGMSWHHSVR